MQRLKNGIVFTIDWNNLAPCRFIGADDQLAGHDQGFFVGEGDVDACFDSRMVGRNSAPTTADINSSTPL